MQFNFLTSNPAFNIEEENNVAKTGGNSTLYRTMTRRDFSKYLKYDGILANITLKGIIGDLVYGNFFNNYQVYEINLMDNINVWPYNTCYFFIERASRNISLPVFSGGIATKIYTPYKHERFNVVCHTVANNGMSGFSKHGDTKVIRQLPGKDRDDNVYDYTDKKEIPPGWKFAFYIMESTKSYTVTDELIYGGTICYVITNTKQEAERLKQFTLKNKLYKEYIKRMNIRGHAIGLRDVKKFDLSKIPEDPTNWIPEEWGVDCIPEQKVILNDKILDPLKEKRLGQIFTPSDLSKIVLDDLEKIRPDAFLNPNYTFCDTMAGNGSFLVSVLDKKMSNNISHKQALKTIYGVEIDPQAVQECRNALIMGDETLRPIVEKNIVNDDTFKYNFEFGQFDNIWA